MSLPIRPERPGTLAEAHAQLDTFWSMIETLHTSQEQLQSEVAELRGQVAELTEKQGSSSQNSSKPPSTDSPEQRAKRPRRKPSDGADSRTGRRSYPPTDDGSGG